MHIISIIIIILHFICANYLRNRYDAKKNTGMIVSSVTSSLFSLVSNTIFQTDLIFAKRLTRVYYNVYSYNILEIVCQSLLYIIMTDLLLYTVHRLLHSKLLYKYIHYFHHKNNYPTALDFASVHPVESIIIFITFHIVPFIIPVHIIVLELYIVHMGIRSLFEHGNGWKMISNITVFKFLYNNHHNNHHKYYTANYGLGVFPVMWDKIFNTLKY